jgi:murein DD-endopeptidase MepM/ murein hydrolase activator NlpD
MKIIVLKESGRSQGQVHAISVRRTHLIVAALIVLSLPLLFAFANSSLSALTSNHEALVVEWQERLARQRAELNALHERSAAESEAVGRQLAAMQARLLRMEALGSRVTEIAKLDEGEFSFDEPAPVGGPTMASQSPIAWSDLQVSLEDLAVQLKSREAELEVLDSLLRDQEFHETTVVSGRPVTWGWMSSPYGKRVDPFTGQNSWHAGVDFAGRKGADVIAVASGVVTFAGKRYGYGQMVEINHGDGYVTRYAHHESLKVAAGDIVKKGEAIGTMGTSGRSTGPHVHFEVLKNGRSVDPRRYVARR